MSREIKFRGLSNGEWVYGNLFNFNGMINKDQCYISDYGSMIDHTLSMKGDEVAIGYFKEVDSKTVGQYTGLKDKNGTDIYEGDIVKCHQDKIWKVQYNEFCCFMLYPMNNKNNMAIYPNMELVQVGNVFENKELLEEVE